MNIVSPEVNTDNYRIVKLFKPKEAKQGTRQN